MKYTLAVMALLATASAIKLRDDDDLWSDDGQATETLASISAAEKAHNAKFNGISKEDQAELLNQRSQMNFQGEEFVKNTARSFPSQPTLLQLEDFHYPEARPIAVVLANIGFDTVYENNDEDGVLSTLESIKSAESTMGAKMQVPQVKKEFYEKTGTKVENLMADNGKISMAMIEEGLKDKDEERVKEVKKVEVQKATVVQKQVAQKTAEQKAFDEISVHFHNDDDEGQDW